MLLPAAFKLCFHEWWIGLLERGREQLIGCWKGKLLAENGMHRDLSGVRRRYEGSCQEQEKVKHCGESRDS